MSLVLKCPQFESGGEIPTQYTCQGDDISPPLRWSGVPNGTKRLALICDDPDAPGGPFSHWVVYNIPPPPKVNGLSEGVPPGGKLSWGGIQGRNDFGEVQYNGPCPLADTEHRYYFRLYALDRELDMLPGATRQQVLDNIQDHIISHTEIIGHYSATMTKTLL